MASAASLARRCKTAKETGAIGPRTTRARFQNIVYILDPLCHTRTERLHLLRLSDKRRARAQAFRRAH